MGSFAEKLDIIFETGIPGGRGEGMTNKDLAKKHKVPVSKIDQQMKKGTEVEYEHTPDKDKAQDIARDHLAEPKLFDYYDRLDKMEKEAKKK